MTSSIRTPSLFVACLLASWIPMTALLDAAEPEDETQKQEIERPNFLVVVADDLGYGDLGCYGHEHVQSPHLDRFASEGVRFTDCYAAAASCSPARTGLMTGRTPFRAGVYSAIPFTSPVHLRPSEVTVATLLRHAGYATGQVGKWHLNGRFNLPGQPQPDDHGFDHWYATQNNALPNHGDPWNFVRNDIPLGPQRGYAADLVADEALRWLGDLRDTAKPFFLYVCFHEPHEPIATDAVHERRYSRFDDPSRRAYYGNITQMDEAFGRLMAGLDSMGLRQDTVVFFTSDNGPAMTRYHPWGSTGGLRNKKGSVYEGGIRVPGMVRWPGRIESGTVSDEPVSGVDLLPTFCALADVDPPADRQIDGTSLVPLLEGGRLRRSRPLYWQYNRARGEAEVALRDGGWKILASLASKYPRTPDITEEKMRIVKEGKLADFELYHLAEDRDESEDLAGERPDRLEAMKERIREFYADVQSDAPVWPEWSHPRYEQRRIEWPAYEASRRPPK